MTTTKGARFYKADFHVHTPASHDFIDKSVKPTDFIIAVEKAGVEILAVTDHNTAEWVKPLIDASRGTGVTVIPGVEITTPAGHIVALFEQSINPQDITDLLIAVGIPRGEHGKEEAISTDHAEEVVRKIYKAGGVAIAAHANEQNGLLKAKGQYKLKLVPMTELYALELTNQEDINRFSMGKLKDYSVKACTQSSDAHTLTEIGRRVVYLKMGVPSLYGIKQALLDHEDRVRFPWNHVSAVHPQVMSMSVDQGFFANELFDFHSGLNCLIGGKGTGKSTVIELLRFAFGDISEFENIKEDSEGKVNTLVGEGGSVTVSYLDSDDVLKTVRREVRSWAPPREVKDESGNPASILTPPMFFSQGELVLIASNRFAQMDLIDERIDISPENRQEVTTIQKLRTNAQKLIEGQGTMYTLRADIDHPENGMIAADATYKRLDDQLKDPVLKAFPQWEAEQQFLIDIESAIVSVQKDVSDAISDVDLAPLNASAPLGAPNAADLALLSKIHVEIKNELENADVKMKQAMKAALASVAKVTKVIKPKYEAMKNKHVAVLAAVGQKDVIKASTQLKTLAKRIEALRKSEAELVRLERERTTLVGERNGLLKELAKSREARWKKRSEKAVMYEAGLSDVISINIKQGGDRSAFEKQLQGLCTGSGIQHAYITTISNTLTPQLLLECVDKKDSTRLVTLCGLTKVVAEKLISWLSSREPSALYELEVVELMDKPEISYLVHGDRKKDLKELSTGQKGTVIINLAMVEQVGPLIIDQPEEPLDTESIYGQVVTTLRKSKESRQFIFTTHNANVAVGADAELSHVLGATADKGRIESSGAIDDEKTNRLLLIHLEGGRDALTRRSQKYRTS